MIEAQQMVSFQSGGLTLEGALHLPRSVRAPGVVVCHPHPQYGGDMDSNVVLAICRGLTASGFAALRFNFRGAGGSDGAFDGAAEGDDVRAALTQVRTFPAVDSARIGLAGYSFGALMAAEAASGELRALMLISPPVGAADLRIGWGCPALVVSGDRDEYAPVDRVRIVADAPAVQLQIVEGADHFWWGYEGVIEQAAGAFFALHLLQ